MLADTRYLASSIMIKVVPERDLVHALNTKPEQSACLLRFAHKLRSSRPCNVLFIPLPFVVALLLTLTLITLFRAREKTKANRPFLALIGLCVLQSISVGVRWGYGVEEVRYVLPIIAGCLPPLVYASFRSLMNDQPATRNFTLTGIVVSPLIILLLMLIYPLAIDFALITLFVGYAVAIIALGRSGPDGLDEARFASVAPAHRALYIAAGALCLSACFDFLVLLDFEWTRGANVAAIVSNANLLGLFLIGLTASVAEGSKVEPEAGTEAPSDTPVPPSTEDREVMERLEHIMQKDRLYRDENLNLTRLSRRLGLPSRQISNAINRSANMNVSQYVNQLRIREACRLLEETEQSVTSIMLDAGFQTKSNFNREFRRITGLSPVAWREREVWKLVSTHKNGHPEQTG